MRLRQNRPQLPVLSPGGPCRRQIAGARVRLLRRSLVQRSPLHAGHLGHGGGPDVIRDGFPERHFVHSVSLSNGPMF
jgi:hypothetical protein